MSANQQCSLPVTKVRIFHTHALIKKEDSEKKVSRQAVARTLVVS